MPTPCTICQNPDRPAIDAALTSGQPITQIAAQHHISRTALHRHYTNHLKASIAQATRVAVDLQLGQLLARVNQIHAQTAHVLNQSLDSLDTATTLRAILRMERQVQLALNIATRPRNADPIAPISAAINMDVRHLRDTILQSLEPHPEAFETLTQALTDPPNTRQQSHTNHTNPASTPSNPNKTKHRV